MLRVAAERLSRSAIMRLITGVILITTFAVMATVAEQPTTRVVMALAVAVSVDLRTPYVDVRLTVAVAVMLAKVTKLAAPLLIASTTEGLVAAFSAASSIVFDTRLPEGEDHTPVSVAKMAAGAVEMRFTGTAVEIATPI